MGESVIMINILLLIALVFAGGVWPAGPADLPWVWSSFLGSESEDQGHSVGIDLQGRVVVAGMTSGVAFPAGWPARAPLHGVDAFAVRVAAGGASLDYAYWFNALTLFAEDEAYAVAVDPLGNAYVTGYTRSADFCTVFGSVPGYQPVYQGETDAFVVKIRADGSGLAYCTFVGGSDWDVGRAIAVDNLGNAYVAGGTWSDDFPVTSGAVQPALAGQRDSFLVTLDAAGSALLYGSYFGGTGQEEAMGVQIGSAGSAAEHVVFAAGWTNSADFPTTPGVIGPVYGGNTDGFVYRLDLAAGRLDYATYLGGDGQDRPAGLALHVNHALVAGSTQSAHFPTTAGALADGPLGGQDGFASKLAPDGRALLFSTYLGGSGDDSAAALTTAIDDGTTIIAGGTASPDLPTTGLALSTALRGPRDAMLLRLSHDGARLIYGSYLGGDGLDQALGVAANGVGQVIVTGSTTSEDFPVTTLAFDETYNGGGDIFVTRLSLGVITPPAEPSLFLPLLLRYGARNALSP
jgi:hypothetical protein